MTDMRLVYLLALLPSLWFGQANAAACDDLFGNVAGAASSLEIKDNAKLFNTGDRVLNTDNLTLGGHASCDGQKCLASILAPSLVKIAAHGGNDLKSQSITWTPGDHYYDDVDIQANDVITLAGVGQVRVHVNGDLKINGNAKINDDGDASQLVFIVREGVDIQGNAQVAALVYAGDQLNVSGNAKVAGAVFGKDVQVSGNAQLTFSQPSGTVSGLCGADSAGGGSCDALFPNAFGARSKLELKDDVRLLNTGNRVLQTDDLKVSGSASCDGASCLASGTAAPLVDFSRPSTSTDLSGSRSFSAGEYSFEDVNLSDKDLLTVSGSGQVRIYVRDDLSVKQGARVNPGGDAKDLVFLVYDDVKIEDQAEVTALIYARDKVELKDDAVVTGALVGDDGKVEDDVRLTYQSPNGAAIADICEAGGTPPDTDPKRLPFRVEVGALTVIDTYAKPEFTRVNFTQTFDEPPVVFTLPTTQGGNSAAHRIRNVTVDGFDIMTLEPLGEDGPHVAMALNYLAVEKGSHQLPGGRKLRVDTVSTKRHQAYGSAGSGWESVSFGGDFSQAPAVLGQIQTMLNEQETRLPAKPSKPWLTTAIAGVSAASMKLALERSESLTGSISADETIGYLAVEPVERLTFLDSSDNEITLEVIRSSEIVEGWGTCNNSATRVHFGRPWDSAPIVLATKNTRDGDSGIGEGDGGWLRRCTTTKDYVGLAVDEVRSNKEGDRNRKHTTPERAGVLVFSDNFVTEARQLDHYRLEHDGNGIAGVPETVTLKVCRNSDCSELYTGSVTVTFTPGDSTTSWSGSGVLANQVTFSGGSRTVSLKHLAGGSITLGLDATPKAANARRCYVGAKQDCKITFAATDFTVQVPDQVSGNTAQGSVSLAGCFDAVRSTSVSAAITVNYLDPSSAGPAVRVNGVWLPVNGSAGSVPLSFDGNCAAPISVHYEEAGQVELAVVYTASGAWAGVQISGSDDAVFYPAQLQVLARDGAGNLLNATTASGSPVQPAGQGFDLQISALNAAGAVTTRYRPQAADRLLGYLRRTGPVGAGSVDGSLQVSGVAQLASRTAAAASLGDFAPLMIAPADVLNGVYRYPMAAYSEVGLVALDITDSDYFGHQIDAAETAIGRFVPASFRHSALLLNRANTAGCSGGAFSYLDEPLSARIALTAQNAAGIVTRNYLGSFARFNPAAMSAYAGSAGQTLAAMHGGADLSGRLAVLGSSAGSWAGGGTTLDIDFAVQRAGAPDGPFDGMLFGLSVSDQDGVLLSGLDMDLDNDSNDEHALIGASNLRYGRVALGTAHGSDLADLPVPAQVQYFAGAGTGFVTHTADTCSPLGAVSLADVDGSDSLAVSDTCIWDALGASGGSACATPGAAAVQYSGSPSAGVYQVVLAAPGSGHGGSLYLDADAPPYLEFDWTGGGAGDPRAILTFGIHSRDTSVIYQRELR